MGVASVPQHDHPLSTYRAAHIALRCAPFFKEIETVEQYDLAMQNQAASQAELTSTGDSSWYNQYAAEHPKVHEVIQPLSISVATDQSIRVTIPASSGN